MAITIRRATKQDLVAVRAQLVETWHATYDPIYGPDVVRDITRRWHSLVALAIQIDHAESAFLIATDEGAVLASSFAQLETDVAKLYRLYVHPSAQSRGLGRRLMTETFQALGPAIRHRLEVEPRNSLALRFYEREGFVRVSEIPDVGRPDGIAAYVYERLCP
jgi:ribosomal protein S18 acetylase RimI-like enzyme